MLKAIKVRIYPNNTQQEYLSKLFGCSRFVYNKALDYKKTAYEQDKTNISYNQLSQYITNLKKQEDTSFLKEVHSVPLQQSLKDLDQAYKHFFKGKGFPKFKNRHGKQSIRFNNQLGKKFISSNKVKLNIQLANIIFKCSKRDMNYLNKEDLIYKSVTISKTKTNKYFLSILVEREHKVLPNNQNTIGIDLGIKDLIITSDGEVTKNNKYIRTNQKKLSKLQRNLSKKTKGSNRFNKTRLRLAKLHEKISNQKNDFLHKEVNKLINENQVICLEDLNVKGMMKNHKLARSIQELSLNEFRRILEYKCKWNNRELVFVDRFYPSSKTCSNCGSIKQDLTLSDRKYNCSSCGTSIDRDINAAINIHNEGQRILEVGTTSSARGEDIRPKKSKTTKATSKKRETTSSLVA